MKTINLLHSRLPLPADGPLPDLADFLPGAQRGEIVGGKIPFFLRGSVILLLLLVGLGLVGAGVYRFFVSPLDFSGEPRPVAQESSVAKKVKPVPPTPVASRPVEANQTPGKVTEIPSAGPVSPAETGPVSKPPPPEKPPAETVATALLPSASDKDVEKDVEEVPPSTVREKEATPLAPKTPQKAPEKTASVPSGSTASTKTPKAGEAPSELEKKASVPGVELKEPAPATTPPKPEPASQAEPAKQKDTPQTKVSTPTEKEAPKIREQIEAPPVTPPQAESPPKEKLAAIVRTGGYSIQVGACKTSRCIQRFLEKVKKAGFTPHTKKSANQKLTLIRVGSYKTVGETRSDIQQLKAKGFKGSYAVKQ